MAEPADRAWRVRPATSADCDRLALVGAATFLETFAGILNGDDILLHCRREHDAAAYSRHLAQGARAWLAEVPGGAPVGFALLARPDLPTVDPDGPDLELKRIYSLSRFHGSGVGPALMAAAVSAATQAGAPRILLGVYRHNARAIAFYTRQGFTHLCDRTFRVGNTDHDDVVLVKPLR